jgi:hypothetical protein
MEPGFRQPFKKRRSLLRHTSCGEAEPCHFAFGDNAERLLGPIDDANAQGSRPVSNKVALPDERGSTGRSTPTLSGNKEFRSIS